MQKKFTRRAAAKRLQTKCRALKGGSLHDFIRKLILIRHTPQYHSFTVNRILRRLWQASQWLESQSQRLEKEPLWRVVSVLRKDGEERKGPGRKLPTKRERISPVVSPYAVNRSPFLLKKWTRAATVLTVSQEIGCNCVSVSPILKDKQGQNTDTQTY